MTMILGIANIILAGCTLGAKRLDSLGRVTLCGQERRQIVLILLQKELFMNRIGKIFKFKEYVQRGGMS